MSLSNPQVQLICLRVSGQSDKYFLYVTSHFSYSNYEAAGVDSISGPDGNGKLSVSILVTTSGEALRMNKSVVHQIDLTGITATAITSTEVKVYESSNLLTTVIVSQDESEIIVKPDNS